MQCKAIRKHARIPCVRDCRGDNDAEEWLLMRAVPDVKIEQKKIPLESGIIYGWVSKYREIKFPTQY